ncbi:MAG: LUD domain-containing protein, partial [Candidatus Micrarchaeota archaeon]
MNQFEQELSREISRRKTAKKAVASVVDEYYLKRAEANLSEEEMRSKLRAIKEKAIGNLDELIQKAKSSFEKKGVKVIIAKDAASARNAIEAEIGSAKRIVKSKSNTCKEIGIEELERGGREITETDTGDFVVKLVGEKGIHQVIPAMHLTPEQIAEAMNKKMKKRVPADPEKITHEIAAYLREKIMEAEVGITGANVLTATGEIILIENEGN